MSLAALEAEGKLRFPMSELTGVNRESIPIVWPFIMDMVEECLDYGEDLHAVYLCLIGGGMQLVLSMDGKIVEALCITEMVDDIADKGVKFVNICYVAGRNRENWFKYLHQLEAWAKEQGCNRIKISKARLGLKPELEDLGYKVKALVLEKEL